MKYMCLVHFDEAQLAALSPEALAALRVESTTYDELLEARGQLVVAEALQRAKTAKVVQVRDARMSHTSGPFAETRELLGGFLLIEVGDLNAAIQVAAKIPMARYGSIEVRPVAKVERMAQGSAS